MLRNLEHILSPQQWIFDECVVLFTLKNITWFGFH